jgi:hypothetical protein
MMLTTRIHGKIEHILVHEIVTATVNVNVTVTGIVNPETTIMTGGLVTGTGRITMIVIEEIEMTGRADPRTGRSKPIFCSQIMLSP